ncbi:MAG: response regulator [Ardenticatenales bacterium]|nr:response regulator [Ardenticatenales bacterium]
MSDKTVVSIEDNYHNRRLVRKILESSGFVVVEAEDGLSGLALVRKLRPRLVLLDIGLPDIDGLEVVRQIRADADLAGIKVIAISASAMRGDRELFLAAGCDDYLAKPIKVAELLHLVELHWPSGQAAEVVG